jgi:hypothetical protein
MPVTNVDRLEAMLATVGQADVAALSPAERRRLADGCRRVALLATPEATDEPKAAEAEGVLDRLKRGERSQ